MVIWASTALLQIPLHNSLGRGLDVEAIQKTRHRELGKNHRLVGSQRFGFVVDSTFDAGI